MCAAAAAAWACVLQRPTLHICRDKAEKKKKKEKGGEDENEDPSATEGGEDDDDDEVGHLFLSIMTLVQQNIHMRPPRSCRRPQTANEKLESHLRLVKAIL